jgi:hypothetical protein
MAKKSSDGTDFNFGFNAVKAAKKKRSGPGSSRTRRPQAKRRNPIRYWNGIRFGSGEE